MIRKYLLSAAVFCQIFFGLAEHLLAQNNKTQSQIQEKVDAAVMPVMKEQHIHGMAIAVTIAGEHYFFNYGVASKETQIPVTNETIFELGSISKTFTATLASYAQVIGKLSLNEPASKYLPKLKTSGFDKITVLNLGTHTTGGLPLQVPDEVTNDDQFIDYLKTWKPVYEAGTYRSYSNPGTGLLGMVAAKSLNKPFDELMEKTLFPALGLGHSYITVPTDQMNNYAFGYSKEDKPIRVTPGVIDSESYGVKSTPKDMIRFVDANMSLFKLDKKWQKAINEAHTGYFRIGTMTQALMWERYPYPVELKDLLAGNSPGIILEHNPASKLVTPQKSDDVLINKTGSTNGFGGYVAFVPSRKIGVVILANKNYPISERIKIAHQILSELEVLRK